MIGCNADVHGATFDHFEHRIEYAYDSTIGSILTLVEAPQTVEVPEQFVGPVYDVNDHLAATASCACGAEPVYFALAAAVICSSVKV